MDACSPPPHANIITGKWVFKNKFHPDGTLDRHKVRWVICGFRQRAGVDFTDTFAPVIKPGTIRTVLQLAVSRAWLMTRKAHARGEPQVEGVMRTAASFPQ
ncbi:hypothetical protein QYE76_035471 [Lolium multiflorum]|uniref:Reverse transcriptase Ty1/copia-type domain-containing protein n=1 Tax=Lolium multiflorum TaxID=4521 RepID=A0AAD8QZA2_LOLMU|nr:hypothetical protein QYE76_035471 [Lolium multiflorum]